MKMTFLATLLLRYDTYSFPSIPASGEASALSFTSPAIWSVRPQFLPHVHRENFCLGKTMHQCSCMLIEICRVFLYPCRMLFVVVVRCVPHMKKMERQATVKSNMETGDELPLLPIAVSPHLYSLPAPHRKHEAMLERLSNLDRCSKLSDPSLKSRLKADFEGISASIADLESSVSEKSYFLPSYGVRSSLKSIAHLLEAMEAPSRGPVASSILIDAYH